MSTLNIINVGNSAGVILPKEILAKLHVGKGDVLYVTETPDGISLTPYNEKHAKVMDAAQKVMKENRDVLRKLAE